MARWSIAKWYHVTDEEYRANLAGLNTFFGAVIGLVMADVTTADSVEFGLLLAMTASLVCGVLYISASHRRWWYAGFLLLATWKLPEIMPKVSGNLGRLQVTLAVWTLMTVLLEAWVAWQRRLEARRTASRT